MANESAYIRQPRLGGGNPRGQVEKFRVRGRLSFLKLLARAPSENATDGPSSTHTFAEMEALKP